MVIVYRREKKKKKEKSSKQCGVRRWLVASLSRVRTDDRRRRCVIGSIKTAVEVFSSTYIVGMRKDENKKKTRG